MNNDKRHQITKSAKLYLSRYGTPQPPARFNVVAIVWPDGREPQIRHTPHAFEPVSDVFSMIDSHCHLTDPRLAQQLEGVLKRAAAAGSSA